MGKVDKFLRVIDSLSEWTGKAVSFFIFLLALIVGYEVVVRYLFKSPTLWVHETSAMFFGTFIIIGGAYTALKGGHVNMDLIHKALGTRARALLDILTFSLALAFLSALLWKGGATAWKSVKTLEHASTQWGPPIFQFRVMLPLGALLLLLQLIAKFIRDLRTLITGKEDSEWKSEP
jgi:TRAP-type mannitol/chloroaromatic compound transport system permease small subunit